VLQFPEALSSFPIPSIALSRGSQAASLLHHDTHPIITLNAPSGVTKIAGAKVYAAKFATSPTTIVAIPIHQIGFLKYAISSDAFLPPPPPGAEDEDDGVLCPFAALYDPRSCVAASLRPFLVMMNDVPMASEEETARPRPMYLSSTICGVRGGRVLDVLLGSTRCGRVKWHLMECWPVSWALVLLGIRLRRGLPYSITLNARWSTRRGADLDQGMSRNHVAFARARHSGGEVTRDRLVVSASRGKELKRI
jgi:hypothetical protein